MRQMSRPVWRQLCSHARVTRPLQRCCSHAARPAIAVSPAAGLRWNPHRLYSSESNAPAKPLTDRTDAEDAAERKRQIEERKAAQPSYQLFFTCTKCLHRSGHLVSKQGYHHGTILINCPGCSNKHLISDHLGIFSDRGVTLEDIMKEKGELLKKGVLGADGDVEFYSDDHKSTDDEKQDT